MGMLDGKVAIVSGVGPGMGRDIALTFAREGADLALGARTVERVAAVAADVEAIGRKATVVRLDICDRASCDNAVDEATSVHGGIDILVNNAFHDGNFKTFEESDLDEGARRWTRTSSARSS